MAMVNVRIYFLFFFFSLQNLNFLWGAGCFFMNTAPYTFCVESLNDGWLFCLVNRSLSVIGQCTGATVSSHANKYSFFSNFETQKI